MNNWIRDRLQFSIETMRSLKWYEIGIVSYVMAVEYTSQIQLLKTWL